MNKKNISIILLFAGGITIANGLGNYFLKSFSVNYLLFMLIAGIILIGIGAFLKKKN